MITTGKINELVKTLNPTAYNSIIIDNADTIKRYDFCYIHALVQKVGFRTNSLTIAVDDETKKRIDDIIHHTTDATSEAVQSPYTQVDNEFIDTLKTSPSVREGSLLGNAKKRLSEFINGGRSVEINDIRLDESNGKILTNQPSFIVRNESSISFCPECKGRKTVESTTKDNVHSIVECPTCDGKGYIASLTWFTPSVSEKETSLVRCLDSYPDSISTEILERHKGDPTQTVRMKAHYNGHDIEQYPDALRPYLDMMHDKTGEPNAIEDIYFKIITCYSFTFRNVLTGKLDTGIIVEPSTDPELIIPMGKTGGIISGMKDRIKKINNFFGNIGKTDNFKDNEDLRRTIRLLIAIAVADGNVSDDEKQSLTLSIRNIDQLTNSDCDELLKLLSMNDSSFLTDDDFKFHSHENAEVTLNRMQEIATADGNVDDTERDIIERLKFKY